MPIYSSSKRKKNPFDKLKFANSLKKTNSKDFETKIIKGSCKYEKRCKTDETIHHSTTKRKK